MKKEKNIRKTVLVVIAAIGSLVFLGCHSSKEVLKEENKVILRFFHYQGEAEEAYNKLFDAYEQANPNVKIVSEFINSDSYGDVLEARIAIKDYPDVIGVHPGSHVLLLGKAGYLADLSENGCLAGSSESSLKAASVGESVYGVPTDQSYICTFYNKKIFEEYQLEIPKTWDEFMDVCRILKENDVTPISIGFKDTWLEPLVAYAVAPTTIYKENEHFDDEMYAGKKNFQGEEWYSTLEMVQKLFTEGYVPEKFLDITYEQQLDTFAQEKAGMMIMGSWAVSMIQNLNPECEFGLFVTPASDDGENWIAASVGGMLGVCEKSEQKETAMDFLNFFLQNDEVYGQFLEDTGNLSARMDFMEKCDLKLQQLMAEVDGSYSFLDVNWPSGFSDDFCAEMEAVGRGKEISPILDALDISWKKRIEGK